jgi:hypothetical protein
MRTDTYSMLKAQLLYNAVTPTFIPSQEPVDDGMLVERLRMENKQLRKRIAELEKETKDREW